MSTTERPAGGGALDAGDHVRYGICGGVSTLGQLSECSTVAGPVFGWSAGLGSGAARFSVVAPMPTPHDHREHPQHRTGALREHPAAAALEHVVQSRRRRRGGDVESSAQLVFDVHQAHSELTGSPYASRSVAKPLAV